MSGSKPKRHSRKIPIIRQLTSPGAMPGTLAVDPTAPKPRISVIGYGPDDFMEAELATPGEIAAHRGTWPVLWINVDGLGDHEVLHQLGAEFQLHRLALEDVVNVPQRAKCEAHDDHLFFVARMISYGERLETEQVSLFVGDGYVLTFQEREGDSFDPVRDRIKKAPGRIRTRGPDYLAYALIDALVDGYYPVLERFGERIEALEEEVLSGPEADIGGRIHTIKRELLRVRRALAPHREALYSLQHDQSRFIGEVVPVYLRDCSDHVIQLIDLVETYRELSSGLLDVYLTTVSNRMNEVMKVLTMFAAIFIPLSFIAGLYGMNFNQESPWNMPELTWSFGYPVVLLLMAIVAGGLLLFFRRRGWIGQSRRTKRDPQEK